MAFTLSIHTLSLMGREVVTSEHLPKFVIMILFLKDKAIQVTLEFQLVLLRQLIMKIVIFTIIIFFVMVVNFLLIERLMGLLLMVLPVSLRQRLVLFREMSERVFALRERD